MSQCAFTFSGLQKYSYHTLNFSTFCHVTNTNSIYFIGVLCKRPKQSGIKLRSTKKFIYDLLLLLLQTTNKKCMSPPLWGMSHFRTSFPAWGVLVGMLGPSLTLRGE